MFAIKMTGHPDGKDYYFATWVQRRQADSLKQDGPALAHAQLFQTKQDAADMALKIQTSPGSFWDAVQCEVIKAPPVSAPDPAPLEIEVCERAGAGYHAQVKGKRGVWACGRTINDAVGELILCHPDQFGLKITVLNGVTR